MCYVLVSSRYYNKLPQDQWLTTTQNRYLMALCVRSSTHVSLGLIQGTNQIAFLLEALGRLLAFLPSRGCLH